MIDTQINRIAEHFEKDQDTASFTPSSERSGEYPSITINVYATRSPSEAAENLKLRLRIAELERKVAHLETQQRLDAECNEHASSVLEDRINSIKKYTESYFQSDVNVVERQDPEIESEKYYLFEVKYCGDIEDALELESEWHKRIVSLSLELCRIFRISISFD